MLAVSVSLALLALVFGAVGPREVPALLYGVNAGGCGTPIASIANLIGADLYLRGRVGRRRFWTPFLVVSGILLAVAIPLSLFLVRLTP